jgi:hypothetical protein
MSLTAIRNLLKGFVTLKNNGTTINNVDRTGINLIPGTNITITTTDDPINNEVDVTINSTGGGSLTINQVMAHIAAY